MSDSTCAFLKLMVVVAFKRIGRQFVLSVEENQVLGTALWALLTHDDFAICTLSRHFFTLLAVSSTQIFSLLPCLGSIPGKRRRISLRQRSIQKCDCRPQ